jgi:LysM repeat protein/GH24 family phage-related lysozyme (muramidase)
VEIYLTENIPVSELSEYVLMELLPTLEGTAAHTDPGDVPTGAYGVTNLSGLKRKQGESEYDFAKRALEKFEQEARQVLKNRDIDFDTLPRSVQAAMLDLTFNIGSSSLGQQSGMLQGLKDKDYQKALQNTLDILRATDVRGNAYSSPGLAKRRASLYNLVARDQGFEEIDSVNVTATAQGLPTYDFVGQSGPVRPSVSLTTTPLDSASLQAIQQGQNSYAPINFAGITSVAETPSYTVEPGDTLYSIAQKTGRSVEELRTINNILDPTTLQPGITLMTEFAPEEEQPLVEESSFFNDLIQDYANPFLQRIFGK